MIERIQKATASSPEGARGLIKGVLACALQNVSFMLPTGLLYFLVKDLMEGTTAGRTAFCVTGCVVCFAFILLTTWFQYNGTYFTTYKESGIRRLTLAERLRKLYAKACFAGGRRPRDNDDPVIHRPSHYALEELVKVAPRHGDGDRPAMRTVLYLPG